MVDLLNFDSPKDRQKPSIGTEMQYVEEEMKKCLSHYHLTIKRYPKEDKIVMTI